MSEKKYIIKDGELIIRKPIDQSEVPNPPQINSKSTSHYFRMFLALIVLIALCTVFILPQTRNALADTVWTITEWDNVKDYNEETKTITITNALSLGDTIAEIKLISEQHMFVLSGEPVAEIEINNHKDYANFYQDMEVYEKGDLVFDINDWV